MNKEQMAKLAEKAKRAAKKQGGEGVKKSGGDGEKKQGMKE